MLDELFRQLKTYENHRLTRLDIVRVEQIKETYIKYYKNLPTNYFQIHLDAYFEFIRVYQNIKKYRELPKSVKRRQTRIELNYQLVNYLNESEINEVFIDESFLPIPNIIYFKLNVDTAVNQLIEQYVKFLLNRPHPLALPSSMATFSYDTALKLDELSSSSAAKVEEFIDQLDSYYEILNETSKTTLIKFILKTKIKGEARTRLGTSTATTLEELSVELKAKVLARESTQELNRKLQSAYQGKKSLVEYAKYITDLTTRLAAASLKETPTLDGASTKANFSKLGLAKFKEGVRDEYKMVVAAARPQTIDEAVQIASEAPPPTSNDVYFYSQQHNRSGRNYNPTLFRGNQRGNYRGQNYRGTNFYRGSNRGGNYRGTTYRGNNYRGNSYRGGNSYHTNRNFNAQHQPSHNNQTQSTRNVHVLTQNNVDQQPNTSNPTN